MARSAVKPRISWQERWKQPALDELLKPINVQRRRLLELVIAESEQFDAIKQRIVWYGPGWHWTIQYEFDGSNNGQSGKVLCYLVPNIEGPLVCVPLVDDEIEKLPMRRLNKMVRNGIVLAKCAVDVHWATWAPTNQTEIAHINDLIKRKHKLTVGKSAPKSRGGKK